MIVSGHYYYSPKGITGIILITNTNPNGLDEIMFDVMLPDTVASSCFQRNSTMSDHLIHIGPSLSDITKFIESNPEYFI